MWNTPEEDVVTAVGATGDVVLRTAGLTKWFWPERSLWRLGRRAATERILAVDDVHLELRAGEIFGLVGPNGAGKTTLIKMLTTLLLPSRGRAWILDHDVVRDAHRARQMVGLVTSNERSFYWRLTGRQNLEFFAALYRLPRQVARGWIAQLLDMVGMTQKAGARFDTYSTGMRQRLALARGLLSRPKVLLMDEPTKGVDPVGAGEIIELIQGPIRDGWRPTILITSHNLTEIERLCGRIGFLYGGREVASGDLDALRRAAGVARRYRLRVRGIGVAQLEQLAERLGLPPVEVTHQNGTLSISLQVARDSDDLARTLRGLVHLDAEVLDCASEEASFDEVFHSLLRLHARAEREL